MTDEEALKQLNDLLPGRKFEIRRSDKVRVYDSGRCLTVRDNIEQCVAVCRWYVKWLKDKHASLRDELALLNADVIGE